MNKILLVFAFVCLFGISFSQTNQDLLNLATDLAPEVIANAPESAVVRNGNDGVEVTWSGTNLTNIVIHLDSVDLSENTEAEWFVEWVDNEDQVWDVVDDGNGYFTVNGPNGSQDYYVPANEWIENIPQESISGIIDNLTGDLVNLVQEAGGELDLTLVEAYTAAAVPIATALAEAAATNGGSATTTVTINQGGR